MPSFDTWAEIKLDILDRAEEETGEDASEFYDFVDRAGDRCYHDLLSRRPWLFARARRPLILQARAPIATTITWTAGLYTATLGAAQSVSLVGWKVKHPTRQEAYRVVTHIPGATGITLEAPLQGATLAAGTAVVLFKDEYDLAEIQEIPTAPTAALGSGAGSVDNGAHAYKVTFVSANGETEAGAASGAATVVDKTVNGKVALSAIPVGPPGTIARRLYRTVAAGTVYLGLATIADNATTTYTDNIADASLSTDQPPQINRTAAVRHIVGMWVPASNQQIRGPWSEEWLREEYADPPSTSWPPTGYARIAEDRVRFSHYPSEAGLIEVPHTFIARDLSVGQPWEILVPRNWRWVLSDGGLFFLYQLKEDGRATAAGARYEKGIGDMEMEDETKKLGLEGTRDRTRKEPAWGR